MREMDGRSRGTVGIGNMRKAAKILRKRPSATWFYTRNASLTEVKMQLKICGCILPIIDVRI
jgi:hypothetical protein